MYGYNLYKKDFKSKHGQILIIANYFGLTALHQHISLSYHDVMITTFASHIMNDLHTIPPYPITRYQIYLISGSIRLKISANANETALFSFKWTEKFFGFGIFLYD
jgi:hypothetical protein